ncbi:MAG: hypothetical protein J5806_07905 [Lentisphaeria bacterium]|nr:hypothetical protein [Lentisphaeria bacterium]
MGHDQNRIKFRRPFEMEFRIADFRQQIQCLFQFFVRQRFIFLNAGGESPDDMGMNPACFRYGILLYTGQNAQNLFSGRIQLRRIGDFIGIIIKLYQPLFSLRRHFRFAAAGRQQTKSDTKQ